MRRTIVIPGLVRRGAVLMAAAVIAGGLAAVAQVPLERAIDPPLKGRPRWFARMPPIAAAATCRTSIRRRSAAASP